MTAVETPRPRAFPGPANAGATPSAGATSSPPKRKRNPALVAAGLASGVALVGLLVASTTEEGRERNRRVEVWLR